MVKIWATSMGSGRARAEQNCATPARSADLAGDAPRCVWFPVFQDALNRVRRGYRRPARRDRRGRGSRGRGRGRGRGTGKPRARRRRTRPGGRHRLHRLHHRRVRHEPRAQLVRHRACIRGGERHGFAMAANNACCCACCVPQRSAPRRGRSPEARTPEPARAPRAEPRRVRGRIGMGGSRGGEHLLSPPSGPPPPVAPQRFLDSSEKHNSRHVCGARG